MDCGSDYFCISSQVRESIWRGPYDSRRMPTQRTQVITVVIADDHRSFGEALEVALDTEGTSS